MLELEVLLERLELELLDECVLVLPERLDDELFVPEDCLVLVVRSSLLSHVKGAAIGQAVR